ncbi:uncharacterized protein LOC144645491 [Oculina patagonica]
MTFIGISDDNLLPTASFAQSRVKSSVTEWSIPPCLNFAILVQFYNACCFVWTSRKGHDHARLQHGKVKRNKASSYMFRRPNCLLLFFVNVLAKDRTESSFITGTNTYTGLKCCCYK